MSITKWAIVGTGYIANQFAQGMQAAKDAKLQAVVSRTRENAEQFAGRYGGAAVYTDFEEMLEKEAVDVVYIGIPNDCHYAYIMAALEHGVPVLSEKPMVDNMRQLEDVLAKAKEKNVFLMEGMWTRCFPAVRTARRWLAEGRIGRPLAVHSAFDIQPKMEEWQPWKGGLRHAGGSLRDVGIYALGMAYLAFPQGPKNVFSTMQSNGEVDESCHLLLTYENGEAAFVGGAFNQISSPVTELVGEKGRIQIGPEFWHPRNAALLLNDGTREDFTDDYPATGFQYEICAVQQCLADGALECPHFTHEESRKITALIEKTRKGWGIVYEADRQNGSVSL